MVADAGNSAEQIAELGAIIETVRARVRARYPEPGDAGSRAAEPIRIQIADLMPLVHARDAAQAKIAAIGSVNPRRGGIANNIIQAFKRNIARALQWFVRDQVTFNRETVSAMEAILEALNDHNRILLSLAAQTNEYAGAANTAIEARAEELDARTRDLSLQIDVRARELAENFEVRLREAMAPGAQELADIRKHWIEWRAEWERKVAANEVQFLRSVADLQGAFQHRGTLMEANFREIVKAQHNDYLGALDRAGIDIQKRLWADMAAVRQEYDRMIHTELRLIRQRTSAPVAVSNAVSNVAAITPQAQPVGLDYSRFAERFRGTEEYIRESLEFYRPYFAKCDSVLDIGCGRGEFLDLMRDAGVRARGIDLGAESVGHCREKGLAVEEADLFAYLAAQPEGEFDGIFSSQVVEHIEPGLLPEMIRLCAAKLSRGGVLVIETPNPECLAIFATHFYIDPTHTRPAPHPLLAFYMEEAGLGRIEVHRLAPAVESFPEIAELPENFRNRFFGGLDYSIVGWKL